MKLVQSGFAAILATLLWSATALSQTTGEPRKAIGGYDPVAYFTEGRPMEGSSEIHQDFDGMRYHFANAQHKVAFVADPDRYMPQFGGHCAGLLIKGPDLVPGKPIYWSIVDDQLYLFGSAKGPAFVAKNPGALAKARLRWDARNK